jgi:hypothetical protein
MCETGKKNMLEFIQLILDSSLDLRMVMPVNIAPSAGNGIVIEIPLIVI